MSLRAGQTARGSTSSEPVERLPVLMRHGQDAEPLCLDPVVQGISPSRRGLNDDRSDGAASDWGRVGEPADLIDDRLNLLRELKAFAGLDFFVVPHCLIELRFGGQRHLL